MTEIQTTGDFDIMQFVKDSGDKVTALPSEQLAKLADTKAGFDALFNKALEEIESRIAKGETVPGYAMVNGNSTKKWALPEEEMVKKLRARKLTQADYYPPKLASPAQILKNKKLTDAQKKAIEKDLIVTIAGDKKLGHVGYEKPEKDVELMFADVKESVVQSPTNEVESTPEVSFF